jgi:hypothetical protein
MTLDQKKALVADFLARCNDYAEGKLADYRRRLTAASAEETAVLEHKIAQWTTYRSFNVHTLGELEGDTLDGWFCDLPTE